MDGVGVGDKGIDEVDVGHTAGVGFVFGLVDGLNFGVEGRDGDDDSVGV